jgi:hypothetical protein
MVPVLVAACGTPVPGPQTQRTTDSSPIQIQRTKIGIRLASGELHCGKAAGTGIDYGNCLDIPVVVLEVGSTCQALVPYNKLVAHHGSGATVLRWVLHPSKGYKFSDDGIQFLPGELDGGQQFSDVYNGKTNGSDHFQWVVRPNAQYRTFHHWANVIRVSDGTACVPADPLITNQN